jgi:hypothetical protein
MRGVPARRDEDVTARFRDLSDGSRRDGRFPRAVRLEGDDGCLDITGCEGALVVADDRTEAMIQPA